MPSLYRPPWRRVKAFRGRKHNNVTDMRYARGVTRWRQIAETLSEDVAEARFADGRLPTEPELATRFGVNRHTVRRAVGVLADQGLVRVEQGRGTFVASGHIDYLVGRRTRFSANLQREGYAPWHTDQILLFEVRWRRSPGAAHRPFVSGVFMKAGREL